MFLGQFPVAFVRENVFGMNALPTMKDFERSLVKWNV
jgi:hypothetical protein